VETITQGGPFNRKPQVKRGTNVCFASLATRRPGGGSSEGPLRPPGRREALGAITGPGKRVTSTPSEKKRNDPRFWRVFADNSPRPVVEHPPRRLG